MFPLVSKEINIKREKKVKMRTAYLSDYRKLHIKSMSQFITVLYVKNTVMTSPVDRAFCLYLGFWCAC